ncbi:MAG: hypothetical protein HQK93_01905, partial [Nitrospirae bacterium]|nr:hypothetical protein [Nitrospirota bacterium]
LLTFNNKVFAGTTNPNQNKIDELEKTFQSNSGDMSFCRSNYTYEDYVRDINASSNEIKQELAKEGKTMTLDDLKKSFKMIKDMCATGKFPGQ